MYSHFSSISSSCFFRLLLPGGTTPEDEDGVVVVLGQDLLPLLLPQLFRLLLPLLLQPGQTPPAVHVLAGIEVCKLPRRPASVGAGGAPVVMVFLLLLLEM